MRKKRILTAEHKERIRKALLGKKKIFSEQAVLNIREAAAKRRGVPTKPCSEDIKEKIRNATTGKSKSFMNGNPSWFKKGDTPWIKGKKMKCLLQSKIKRFKLKCWNEYSDYGRWGGASRRWSKEIRKRDNFTCQYCKSTDGRLFAHHLKSWKDYPDLRFEISNGITLCEKCHLKEHENDPSRKNLPLWSKGRKFTMEHRLKLSNAHKGKIPWNKGIRMSKKLETVV